MINNLADTFKQILGLNKSINKENIECAIDDNIVDCVEIDEEPYIGVPAPTVLSDDPWSVSYTHLTLPTNREV